MDQLAEYIACNDELRSAHDQLKIEHNEIRADRDRASALLSDTTNELNAIRAELGAIAAAEVQSLASERDRLSIEVLRLRNDIQALLTEQSNRGELIAQLERRVLEFGAIQENHDALNERFKLRETELMVVAGERDALEKKLSEECQALVVADSVVARLRQEIEQNVKDLSNVRQERELANQQLALCKNELCSVQTDLVRSTGEQQSSLEMIEQLTNTVGERDREIATQHEDFLAKLASSQEELRLAERSFRDELEMLKTEFTSLNADTIGYPRSTYPQNRHAWSCSRRITS